MTLVLSNIVLVLFIIYIILTARRGLHILQLEHYYTDGYIKWMKDNSHELFNVRNIIILFIPILIFALNAPKVAYVLMILTYLILILEVPRRKEKKPFVVTPRVARQFITYIILFVILIGLVNVFNDIYVMLVLNILAAIAYVLVYLVACINTPIEKLINGTYSRKARRKILSMPDLTVIGITGSYGKTSVKYIVDTILSQKYNTLKTPESYNTTMGVVRTVNEKLKPTHNMFVCEMGAKYVGDIKQICKIVKPKYGVITAIGPQHLETLKTIENVSKVKLELADSLDNDTGICFVNWEDENIRKADFKGKRIIRYGLKSDADYYAVNVKMNENGSIFDVVMPNGKKINVKTKLLGRLNILNIVGGIAVADNLGLTEQEIKMGINYIKPVEHRLELKKNSNGSIVIDDAYNSNIRGFDMALEVLGAFSDKKRILVTPGIVDLGKWSDEVNMSIGKESTKHADYIIFVGEKQAQPMIKGIQETSFPSKNVYVAKDLDDAINEMQKQMDSNSVVLLENDLPDNYL